MPLRALHTSHGIGGAAPLPAVLGTLLACLAVMACGSSTAASGTAAGARATSLSVVYRPHGFYPAPGQSSTAHRWTLSCNPPRGTHPQRGAACRQLAAHGADLTQTGTQCLVIVRGGPVASVSGTVAGRPVRFQSSTCSRAWSTLHVLLTGSAGR